jgi:hypothetical protein
MESKMHHLLYLFLLFQSLGLLVSSAPLPAEANALIVTSPAVAEAEHLLETRDPGNTSKSPPKLYGQKPYTKKGPNGLTTHSTDGGGYFHYSKPGVKGGYVRHSSGTHPTQCGKGGAGCFGNPH